MAEELRQYNGSLNNGTPIVAFFAGLLHDISLPIISFQATVNLIAGHFASAPFVSKSGLTLPLLKDEPLVHFLHYAAILSALPAEALIDKNELWWHDIHELRTHADGALLHELLLCAQKPEHAIASAAMLLYQAVEPGLRTGQPEHSPSLPDVLEIRLRRFLDPKQSRQREFITIVQAAALHDRRPSAEMWQAKSHRSAAGPIPLSWRSFPHAAITAIADECQEWGRSIGDIDEMAVVDASVDLSLPSVRVQFRLSQKVDVFDTVPYSLIEALFGKVATVTNGFAFATDGPEKPLLFELTLDDLGAFRIQDIGPEPSVRLKDCRVIEFPALATRRSESVELDGMPESRMYSFGTKSGHTPTDLLILEGGDGQCAELQTHLQLSGNRLQSVSVDRSEMKIVLASGCQIRTKLETYVHGILVKPTVPELPISDTGGSCRRMTTAVLKVALQEVDVPPALAGKASSIEATQEYEPHFLDYDWRFKNASCETLMDVVDEYAREGQVCFLGCPSLALWHSVAGGDSWMLLDKGHFALDRWNEEGCLADRWRRYDVFEQVPDDLLRAFSLVIADPPWYDIEYKMFARRARELVAPGGIIGITSYPRGKPYEQGKNERYEQLVDKELVDAAYIGALEVSYEVPEFERYSGQHAKFIDHGIGAYRPTMMDFYTGFTCRMAPRPSAQRRTAEHALSVAVQLGGGHYALAHPKLFGELEAGQTVNVKVVTRKQLERIRDMSDVVAWTTRNTVVTRDAKGEPLDSKEAFLERLRQFESD